MATTEHTINDALAEALKETRRAWEQLHVVRSENIDILKSSGKRPDILVNEPNVSPVIIETEILPAVSLKQMPSTSRSAIISSGKKILFVLAVKLPAMLS